MSRWANENLNQRFPLEEKQLRDKIIKVIQRYTKEMEGYSYFGSNPGVSEDARYAIPCGMAYYEDAADEIMLEFDVRDKE